MPSLTRSELAAYAVCALLIGLLGWHALRADPAGAGAGPGGSASVQPAPATRTSATSAVTVAQAPPASALVDVVGAVRRPGVYRLRGGARVQDAIRRAGGAKAVADLQAINLAAKVADAQQIVVPRRGRGGASSSAVPAAGSAAGGAAPGAPAGPVNLNTATAEQLDTLDGVGPATAQKILQYRQQHGGFSKVEDLDQIPGIGPKRLEALRGRVTV